MPGLDHYSESAAIITLQQLTAAMTTTPQSIVAASGAPQRYDQIILSSTSVANHDVALYAHAGSGNYIIAVVNVPAGAGTSVVPPVDLVAGIPGLPGGVVVSGATGLYFGVLVILGAGEVINAVALGGYL